MLLNFAFISGGFTIGLCSMDHKGTNGGNGWEFPISDTTCLKLVNGGEIAVQLTRVLGSAQEQTGRRPICVVEVEAGTGRGVNINFDDFGPGCRLSCGPEVSMGELIAWVNLLLPVAETVSLHASAFTWKGEGVVVTGSAGSGKTGALLAAIHQGSEAVGDECIWINRNARMRGLFLEMEIRAAYFGELPHLRSEVSSATGYRIYLHDLVSRTIRPFLPNLSRKFAGRARAQVQPDIVMRHLAPPGASVNRLFVSKVHAGPEIRVRPVDIAQVVPQLVEIQSVEFARQRAQYARYRDQAESRQNEWMEGLAQRHNDFFSDALRNTRTYILEHPPSPRARDLFRALAATWP